MTFWTFCRLKRGELDLIVMDMQMPEVDRLQATAPLWSAGIEKPVITLTADAMEGDHKRYLNASCDDYLCMPIDQAKLLHMAASYTQNISLNELRLPQHLVSHINLTA